MTLTQDNSGQEKLCVCSDVEFNKQRLQLTEGQILHDSPYISKIVKLIETKSRLWLPGAKVGEMRRY